MRGLKRTDDTQGTYCEKVAGSPPAGLLAASLTRSRGDVSDNKKLVPIHVCLGKSDFFIMRLAAALAMSLSGAPHIIYEDANYFFAAKPPGMVCAGDGDDHSFHERIKEFANQEYGYQPGLLHRLDKGTSGIMTYAKSEGAAKHYLKLQNERGAIKKEYLAVVHGTPAKPAGRVEGGICKSAGLRTYVVRGKKSGKPVLTTYKLLQQVTHPQFGSVSSLSLRLFTGRKHQIRASCRKLGCSIVGDEQYGGDKHHVMFLHAQRVAFQGADNTLYDVQAEPPPSWAGVGELVLPESVWSPAARDGAVQRVEAAPTVRERLAVAGSSSSVERSRDSRPEEEGGTEGTRW